MSKGWDGGSGGDGGGDGGGGRGGGDGGGGEGGGEGDGFEGGLGGALGGDRAHHGGGGGARGGGSASPVMLYPLEGTTAECAMVSELLKNHFSRLLMASSSSDAEPDVGELRAAGRVS